MPTRTLPHPPTDTTGSVPSLRGPLRVADKKHHAIVYDGEGKVRLIACLDESISGARAPWADDHVDLLREMVDAWNAAQGAE